MKVVLFGAGAMSCLFASRLAGVADVVLVDGWVEGIEAIREKGILLEDGAGSRTIHVRADYPGEHIVPAELAIVLVKAWQTREVADWLASYLSPGGLAISLQNGLGNVEALGARAFPGTTAEGATLLGPGHVRTGGSGPTHVVAPGWAVDLLRSAGFECDACSPEEAEGLLWGKLAVSCGINALTAILRVPNGELLKRPDAAELMILAAEECAAAARAKGIVLPFLNTAERVKEVAQRTAGNRSSMLQDVLRGAPTECDAINGAVVEEAMRQATPVPVNSVLWKLVKAAVHSDRSEARSCA